jgi:CheY-like chemotaxis protein
MTGGATILYVEDETANRALLRAVLSRCGDPTVSAAIVREAGTIAEARRILATERVDLVLLDVRLPDGSGLDLARELSSEPEPRPQVVVMSASVLPAERDAALISGAGHFLPKPYAPAELTRLVGSLLGDPSTGAPAAQGPGPTG